MSRLLVALLALAPLVACAAEEEYIPEDRYDAADDFGDGSYGIAFQGIESVIALPSQACDESAFCGLSLDFGLGDFPQPSREESELARYGIQIEGVFTDFNGDQTFVSEGLSMPDILAGRLSSFNHSAPAGGGGGGWDIDFRPTFSGNILEILDGGFQLTGFRFKATLPLCGGLPCR